jgi:microcystin-dependent protein
MAEPYVGQITIFAGNFAPRGYAFCEGQLMAIASNEMLFSLIGTTYGGDGQTTFALPDLRGRIPVGVGTGPGLSAWVPGERQGQESVTLAMKEMPSHSHTLQGSNGQSDSNDPTNNVLGTEQTDKPYLPTLNGPQVMSAEAVLATGGNQGHSNMAPSLTLNYIIALDGIYPSRN